METMTNGEVKTENLGQDQINERYAFLQTASTSELRSLVREKIKRSVDLRIAPTVVVGMRKEECIEYLTKDTAPIESTKETNGHAKPKGDAASLLKAAIEALGIEQRQPEATIDEAKLKLLIAEEVARSVKPMVTHLEIKTGQEVKVITDTQHRLFPVVMALLAVPDLNICLTGPAGGGKTRVLMEAAKTLKMSVYLQPMNIMTTKSDLGGYMDAQGKYVESSFYRASKFGGLYIADEFDSSNAGMATWLNAGIANRMVTFPNNETVAFHKDFRFCACMNTTGQGATMQYVGRNALDAATLDRFVLLDYQYDKALTRNICGIKTLQEYEKVDRGGVCSDPSALLDFIESISEICQANKYKNVISPRASITACRLSQAGIGMFWIFECVILKGLNVEQKKTLLCSRLDSSIGNVKISKVK